MRFLNLGSVQWGDRPTAEMSLGASSLVSRPGAELHRQGVYDPAQCSTSYGIGQYVWLYGASTRVEIIVTSKVFFSKEKYTGS